MEAAVLLVAVAVVKYAKLDKGLEKAVAMIAAAGAFFVSGAVTMMATGTGVVDLTVLSVLADVLNVLGFITGLVGGVWAAVKWLIQ